MASLDYQGGVVVVVPLVLSALERLFHLWLSIFWPGAGVGELWIRGEHPGVSQGWWGWEPQHFVVLGGFCVRFSAAELWGFSSAGEAWEGADPEQALSTRDTSVCLQRNCELLVLPNVFGTDS